VSLRVGEGVCIAIAEVGIGHAVADRRAASHVDDGIDVPDLMRALLGANERTFERLSRTGAGQGQAERAVEALVAVWSRSIHGTYEGGPR